MRESEFWASLDWVFPGGHGRSLAQDLVLSSLGGHTPTDAIESGVAPRRVWEALCEAMDLPEQYKFLNRIREEDRQALRD